MRYIQYFAVCFWGLLLGFGCVTGGADAPRRQISATTYSNYEADGKPEWIRRGSGAITGDTDRVFYGVGMAGGIKNPALLRTASDNRARAELAKVFETYSASLMKDYANSEGEQSIEQATKTFSAQSLKGAQIVDRYVDGVGTLYSLAQIDLAAVRDAILEAERSGLVKSHPDDGSLAKIFDEYANPKPRNPKLSPVVTADANSDRVASESKRENRSRKTTRERRERPDWVDGASEDFPDERFLCGVGIGAQRNSAENAAYAALARIFRVGVESTSQDFVGAYKTSGAPPVQTQELEILTKTTTQKLFSGVKILEVWLSKERDSYALACLERALAMRDLNKQIDDLDQMVGRYLDEAKNAEKTLKVEKLSKALNQLLLREAQNAELRIVNSRGIGVASPFNYTDVVAAFEAAVEGLKVMVLAEGPHAEEFRGELMHQLRIKGVQILDSLGEGPDIVIAARIEVEDAGQGSGRAKNLHFARAVINVEVKNLVRGVVLGSFTETRKDGSRNFREAARLSIRRLVKKIKVQVNPQLNQVVLGG